MSSLTHINEQNQPGMVDIGAKAVTARTARAQAIVTLPPEVMALLANADIQTKKGPVFQTAIIAGTMGAKKTSELIPLCHPIGLDSCKLDIRVELPDRVIIECRARVEHKTGVEMEALTGATIAALTIYDMCKSFSHAITISEVRLLEKAGGKSGYVAHEPVTEPS